MRYYDYVDLKGKSKIQMKKDAAVTEVINGAGEVTTKGKDEYIYLECKKYDASTGEEATPVKFELNLKQLEREKKSLEIEKARTEKSLAELEVLITDMKAL